MNDLFKESSGKSPNRKLSLHYWKNAFRRGTTEKPRVIELLFFACLLPFGGLLAFPENPTGIASGFPWVVVGSIVFAARYGSGWGVSCAIATGLFLQIPAEAYASLAAQHGTLALGTVVISMLVGDASSTWRRRSRNSEAENEYLRHRLKEFSTDYHVLKVSHGLLEEYMAGQRLSLREALQQLKPVLTSNKQGMEAGGELMAIFSHFCSIQVAGLYALDDDGKIDNTPAAIHGDMIELPIFDTLLRTALAQKEMVSIKLESLAENHHQSSLLAVVPLVDTNGHIHGVLAIKDMHFMAFQQENLNLLALLGFYVGNQLTRSRGEALSRADWFLAELDTVIRFAQSHDTESSLLALKFWNIEEASEAAVYVSESIRSLDASWIVTDKDGASVLCLLLPLMSETQCIAFVHRMNRQVDKKYFKTLDIMLSDSMVTQITDTDTKASCLNFLAELVGESVLYRALNVSGDAGDRAGAA
ncbi:MAG: hypothetical protein ACI8VW_000907 [bacterium]|jgi:hypothetical protein